MENKLIKSLKYQGVYSKKLPNNETIFYIAYKNVHGQYNKYRVGAKSAGITEQYCHQLRQSELAKIRLGEDPKLANKPKVIKFHEIAEDYFYNMELSMCSDAKNLSILSKMTMVFRNILSFSSLFLI